MNLLAHMATFAAVVGMTAAVSAQTLDIRHTAPDNTLVRLTADAHYLLLPVEDEAPDARIDVLDGARSSAHSMSGWRSMPWITRCLST